MRPSSAKCARWSGAWSPASGLGCSVRPPSRLLNRPRFGSIISLVVCPNYSRLTPSPSAASPSNVMFTPPAWALTCFLTTERKPGAHVSVLLGVKISVYNLTRSTRVQQHATQAPLGAVTERRLGACGGHRSSVATNVFLAHLSCWGWRGCLELVVIGRAHLDLALLVLGRVHLGVAREHREESRAVPGGPRRWNRWLRRRLARETEAVPE